MADMAASVLARLRNKAAASGRSHQLCLQLFCQEESTTDGKAIDFPTPQWYHGGVAWCLKNKLMTNHKDGAFGVSETASRATIAEILWRLVGSPQAEEGGGFADVAADAWYAGVVDWAVENGVAAGRGDGTFGPEEPITRELLVCMLYRYAQS